MVQDGTPDEFELFVRKISKETRDHIRFEFSLFKEAAFPAAKQDALDYMSICLIEDEFRKQEDLCGAAIETAIRSFQKSIAELAKRYDRAFFAYYRMTLCTIESFSIAQAGHAHTYREFGMDANLLAESEHEAIALSKKYENRAFAIKKIFHKTMRSIDQDRIAAEQSINSSIKKFLEVELPQSHKRVDAIINQNHLQRVAALHRMN